MAQKLLVTFNHDWFLVSGAQCKFIVRTGWKWTNKKLLNRRLRKHCCSSLRWSSNGLWCLLLRHLLGRASTGLSCRHGSWGLAILWGMELSITLTCCHVPWPPGYGKNILQTTLSTGEWREHHNISDQLRACSLVEAVLLGRFCDKHQLY